MLENNPSSDEFVSIHARRRRGRVEYVVRRNHSGASSRHPSIDAIANDYKAGSESD